MDYYDIAYESCAVNKDFETRLGFKRIFLSNKDVKIVDGSTRYKNNEIEGSIFMNATDSNVLSILNMIAACNRFFGFAYKQEST